MGESGMDMMVRSLLKSAGVDPEKVKTDIVGFGQKLNAKIESMDKSMQELRDEQRALRELLMEGTYTYKPPREDGAAVANGDKQ